MWPGQGQIWPGLGPHLAHIRRTFGHFGRVRPDYGQPLTGFCLWRCRPRCPLLVTGSRLARTIWRLPPKGGYRPPLVSAPAPDRRRFAPGRRNGRPGSMLPRTHPHMQAGTCTGIVTCRRAGERRPDEGRRVDLAGGRRHQLPRRPAPPPPDARVHATRGETVRGPSGPRVPHGACPSRAFSPEHCMEDGHQFRPAGTPVPPWCARRAFSPQHTAAWEVGHTWV